MRKINIVIIALSSSLMLACGGETSNQETTNTENLPATPKEEEKVAEVKDAGEEIYSKQCVACHQATGKGLPDAFPPLDQSDFILNKEATIKQVLNGASGEMVVNGVTYNGTMTPFKDVLSNQEIADVLNYVYKSWGNSGQIVVTAEEVAALKN